MNRLSFFTILILTLSLFSCSKQIKGVVVDNFGNPLKDVEITIKGTEFKTSTNSNGKYGVDYAPGEVIIKFQKDDYIGHNKVLYITEKQDYPLKQITLTKKPQRTGIYIVGQGISDYTPKLKIQRGVDVKEAGSNSYDFFLTNTDSLNIIKLSSLDDVKLYHYNLQKMVLGKVGEDKKIARINFSLFFSSLRPNASITEQIEDLTNLMQIRTFQPEFDTDYVYLYEDGFKNNRNPSPIIYVFRFEKK